jgi:two-component system, NarL family, sensor kinase
MLRRLPIESGQPVVVFAVVRVVLVLLSVVAVLVLGLPYDGRGLVVIGGVLLPWALGVLVLVRRNPELGLNPLVAAGDIAVLIVLELVVPESLGAVRIAAMFLFAAHAHFQGERRGLAIAALGSATLVVGTALRGETHLHGNVLAFYETVFVVAALATGLVVGRLRTTESASRLRARELSRRTIQAESEVRRRVAEALHDGPVQELIGLDMMLAAAHQAAHNGDSERALELIEQARKLTERNIHTLRDEIVDLGPYAFNELGFATAIENCMPAWRQRFGFEVLATLQDLELPAEMAGDLFRIAQEAVVNAGRHARAEAVSISLRQVGDHVELRVTDDGQGFQAADPLGPLAPGHLGLASMRERAELLEGTLDIATSERGTRVLVLVPLRAPVN